MNALKFRFDCFNNRFWKVEDEYSYEVPEECAFTSPYYIGQSFLLDSDQPNHWINFTFYDRSIRVFYKQIKTGGNIIYYQKDIPKAEVIEFELTEEDIIAKRDGRWTKNKKNKV